MSFWVFGHELTNIIVIRISEVWPLLSIQETTHLPIYLTPCSTLVYDELLILIV